MLALLFFFFRLCLNNLFTIEKLFTFSGNFQKSYTNYNTRLELSESPHILLIGVQQLDIVKFALPFEKISFHPIFSTGGKHTRISSRLPELLHDLNIKRLKNSFIESFSLFYSTIKQIILFLLFLLPFQ